MDNVGKMHSKLNKEGSWGAYDRLPPEIKRLIQEAPFNYSTRSIPGALKKLGREKVAEMIRANIKAHIKREALAHYGPAHPQA